ncbi:hypothetical protein [Streptomyces sp. NPDC059515]|uniref:hypothetical protein n=1 Tax=Streptomyces sp. NPDC059515 TaxID=3346854 RepID=UPI0036A1C3D3
MPAVDGIPAADDEGGDETRREQDRHGLGQSAAGSSDAGRGPGASQSDEDGDEDLPRAEPLAFHQVRDFSVGGAGTAFPHDCHGEGTQEQGCATEEAPAQHQQCSG